MSVDQLFAFTNAKRWGSRKKKKREKKNKQTFQFFACTVNAVYQPNFIGKFDRLDSISNTNSKLSPSLANKSLRQISKHQ